MIDTATWVTEIVKSDRLYFDRYKYCFVFVLDELSCLREYHLSNDPEHMKRKIASKYWQRLSWRYPGGKFSTETPDNVQQIQQVAEFLGSVKAETKLTIYQNWGYFYCNNTATAHTLSEFAGIHHNNIIKEISIDRARNTILLKKSDYCYRTYFRDQRVSDEKKHQISKFLKSQPEIAMSPTLTKWCDGSIRRWRSFYTERHYFIDHSELGVILMLQMIDPTVIRKTVGIAVVNNRETDNG